MAFFNDLIETIEKTPPARLPPAPGATSTVLMYAPRRLRADRPDALQKAELSLGERDARSGELIVKQGLTAGDRVLRYPGPALQNGQKIQIAPR